MAIGFFDGNKADASPESIKRKREMIARMMASARSPRNIGEGFNAIGNNIAAAMLGRQSDEEERRVNVSSADAMRGIYSGFGSPMASAGNPVATGSGATRISRGGPVDPAIKDGITTTALSLGIDPVDLATAISYETGGTFDPTKRGPTTQWGQHKGLIQFGQPQARQHGVDWNNPVGSQLGPNGAVASYLRSTGVKPGMGLLDIYSAINAGGVGRYNRSDANNGGAPGTVRDKVEQQMAGHRARAMAMFQPLARPVQTASAGPQSNDAQMQDGAGELQAGGSGLMAEPAVYRGQLNDVPSGDLMQRGPMPALPPGFDLSSLVMPAGQPSGAMGQGIADNEEQTRIMEAQMAAEQGLPYAGNEPGVFNQSDVFSPVPMGLGPNPFLPYEPDAMAQAPAPMPPQMDRATFDQVTAGLPQRAPAFAGQQAGIAPSWAGDPDKLAPGAEQASFVIPARDTVALPAANNRPPQSPFVPPAMRAPLPVDMGGENSGGSAMQFIESEFARREGRPDPRTAMGAPGQIYNPFVQQPTQAPQMPAGGGSVQGVSQGGAMASGPAQAPAQANSRIAYLASVAGNSMNNPEVRQLAMAEIQTERARAQAEADRARTQADNVRAARAAGIDENLLANPVIGKAATEAKFREAPETFRDLTPAERTQRGIDPNDKRPYQISNKTGKLSGVGGAQTTVNVGASEGPDGKMRDTLAKQEGEQFGTHLKAGTTAAGSIQDLDMLDQLIKVAPTGPLTGRLAQMFPGISNGAAAFESVVKRVAPTLRVEGSGATSDIEYQGMLSALPQLVNRPEANQAISQMMRAKAQVNLERAQVVRELQAMRISPDAARAQINEIDKRSILTPQLRQMLQFGEKQSGPAVGTVQGGWRFKGGNPADRNAWEKVQ
jgi:hypothetical protein